MITEAERSQLKLILQSPQWATVVRLLDVYVQSIRDQSCLRDDLWQTARTVAYNEGQIDGIRKFVQELFKEAR